MSAQATANSLLEAIGVRIWGNYYNSLFLWIQLKVCNISLKKLKLSVILGQDSL